MELLQRSRFAKCAAAVEGTKDTVSTGDSEDLNEYLQLSSFCAFNKTDDATIQKPALAQRNTQLELL